MKRRHRFVPPDPPVTPKAVATRRLLIDVATKLFIERGYEAVSMQDIATMAEITKGGVYGHFRSKGQLLVEVIRWKLAEFDRSDDVTASRRSESAVNLMFDDRGRVIRLLEVDGAAAARHDPDVAAGLLELYTERHASIRDALIDLVPDPETAAWLVATLAVGIGAKDAIGIGPPDIARVINALQTMLTDAPT